VDGLEFVSQVLHGNIKKVREKSLEGLFRDENKNRIKVKINKKEID